MLIGVCFQIENSYLLGRLEQRKTNDNEVGAHHQVSSIRVAEKGAGGADFTGFQSLEGPQNAMKHFADMKIFSL